MRDARSGRFHFENAREYFGLVAYSLAVTNAKERHGGLDFLP
jgi:hypothetical protein